MLTTKQRIEQMKEKGKVIEAGGGKKRIEKQHASGKLTARERIDILFDKNTFVEIDRFVAHRCTSFGMEKEPAPGEGVVTGYGLVDGRLVYVYAQDFTVLGGSLGEMHARKITKIQDTAMKTGAPIVALNDSGGARIQEAVDALAGYGQIFYRNTLSSGVIPQISAIMGPCAGGAVYSPALTDFIYMVKNTSQMFITGPQVIKTVTGEDVGVEELGGAMTHNSVSGVAHFVAENDEDCLLQIRRLLSFLPLNNLESPPDGSGSDPMDRMIPEFNTIIPDSSNQPYDMKVVIEKLVDDGDYYEVQSFYAMNIITCLARLDGRSIGIIANQPKVMAGCLDINASDKASRFIRFCDAFGIPVLNIVDVPGFLPGTQQEFGGIIRHGAKMLYAYSEATVPKVTLVTRKAYGGSYIAMCSRDLGADQVIAWPTGEIAVMGASGAANIIFRGDPDIAAKTEEYVKNFATPYQAAARGFADQIIEPAYSRTVLINTFNVLERKRETRPAKRHGNFPV